MTAALTPISRAAALSDLSPSGDPLGPIIATMAMMRARHGESATRGLPSTLTLSPASVTGPWIPATELFTGDRIDDLLDAAKQRWSAQDHVAAALAWKCYTYWVALPAVLGYATARRVPDLSPDNVLLRYADHQPFLSVALRRPAVTVLAGDPIAAGYVEGLRVVRDETELLKILRTELIDRHLSPLVDRMRERVHIGRRTLMGSLASAVAHGLSRAADALPGSALDLANTLLSTLDVEDLVELTPRPSGELEIQRRTCCLAFTLPQPKVCAGCVIRST